MQLVEKSKPVKRSWPGGPLIQCHVPVTDCAAFYVCERCRRPAYTGVRLDSRTGEWLCASL
jgi:hypothetical protein